MEFKLGGVIQFRHRKPPATFRVQDLPPLLVAKPRLRVHFRAFFLIAAFFCSSTTSFPDFINSRSFRVANAERLGTSDSLPLSSSSGPSPTSQTLWRLVNIRGDLTDPPTAGAFRFNIMPFSSMFSTSEGEESLSLAHRSVSDESGFGASLMKILESGVCGVPSVKTLKRLASASSTISSFSSSAVAPSILSLSIVHSISISSTHITWFSWSVSVAISTPIELG